MPKYDVENLLSDIRAILIANLNASIVAVEAEKIAQGLPVTNIKAVDTSIGADGLERGYFEQDWSDKILNTSPAIWYGIEAMPPVGIGPATQTEFKIFIDVVHVDSGQDTLRNKRTNRYTRAIRDVIEANWDRLPGGTKTKIETIQPIAFKINEDSSEEVRVGGVAITTAIA